MASKQTYEKAVSELQQIIDELQNEVVSMDDLSAKVKRAAELIAWCRQKLRDTGAEIDRLFEE